MTDRHRDEPRCLAFVCENASRAQTELAGSAIARAAEAMRNARGVRPRTERLHLVAPAGALRTADLAAALAAEGVPAAKARALAPRIGRALDRGALDALGPDGWVSIHWAEDVPGAGHAVLRRLGTLAIEAAEALAAPRPVSSAVVHLEPHERSPAGPWLGTVAAGAGLFGLSEPAVRALLGEVHHRLVDARPGVRAWLPGAGGATVAVHRPAGRALVFAPFVITDAETRAELARVGLPDAALPAPVRRLRTGD